MKHLYLLMLYYIALKIYLRNVNQLKYSTYISYRILLSHLFHRVSLISYNISSLYYKIHSFQKNNKINIKELL
jgi:hypothetical protein